MWCLRVPRKIAFQRSENDFSSYCLPARKPSLDYSRFPYLTFSIVLLVYKRSITSEEFYGFRSRFGSA